MARLTNPEILACYRNALANWRYDGFVVYLTRPAEWIRLELGESLRAFSRRLHDFVQSRGEIDQVAERRPEWTTRDFHYDLRPTVNDVVEYVETILDYDDPADPDDPVITIVNIHLA